MYKDILIIAELTSENKLTTTTLELIGEARKIAQKLDNEKVNVALVCGLIDTTEIVDKLRLAGADNCFIAKKDEFSQYSTAYFAKAVETIIKDKTPSVVLFSATTKGRDLAPRVSSRLKTGLTADCVALDINEYGKLAATRPTFGGNLMATILCKAYPQMVTVRAKVFQIPPDNQSNTINTEEISVDLSNIENKVELIKFTKTLTQENNEIENAEIIVAGGMGLKSAQNFKYLEELAELLGGKVAATRKVTDLGWRKHSEQVGQTGKTVKPKIYFAFGISGSTQHIVGMSGSETIIAVNTDNKAPIFNIATYGIVGDAVETAKLMINELKQNLPE